MNETERTYKVLGTTEDFDACQCCGRDSLKTYVVLENLLTGEVVHFGTGCAATAEKVTEKVIAEEVKVADAARRAAERAARLAESAAIDAWIEANGGRAALGGPGAALAAATAALAA